MPRNQDFTDKVVLVTGSSAGIGAAAVLEYARLGAKVVITGRSGAKLDKIHAKLTDAGVTADRILKIQGELSLDEDVERLAKETIDKFGTVHVLVNNAGIAPFRPMQSTSEESFMTLMDVNVRSMFYLTKLLAEHLIQNKGAVVNLSSIAGVKPATGPFLPYTISKHVILQFTRALALELGPSGVRVNAVSPGTVAETDIWYGDGGASDYYGSVQAVDQVFEWSKCRYKLGRLPVLNDVVQAIVMLSGDISSFCTGNNLRVDGGTCLLPPAPKPTTGK